MKIYNLISIITLIFIWSILNYFQILNPYFFPKISEIISEMLNLLFNQNLKLDIYYTTLRWFIGLFLAIILGIPLGFLMALSKPIKEILDFPLDFFRSIPVTSLFPLFLLFFGIGNESKIAMVFTASFPIMTLNSFYGVYYSSKKRINMAKIYQAKNLFIFKNIIFMESLTHIFLGLRISISISLIVSIVSEVFIGTRYGLGQRIFDSYSLNLIPQLYALIIIIGLIGYTTNKLILHLEKKIIFWK